MEMIRMIRRVNRDILGVNHLCFSKVVRLFSSNKVGNSSRAEISSSILGGFRVAYTGVLEIFICGYIFR